MPNTFALAQSLAARQGIILKIDEEKCDKCYSWLICPGIEAG